MGGCMGTGRAAAGRAADDAANGGGARNSRRQSLFSDSTSSGQTSKNRPLRHDKIRWKSEVPLTEGQLKSKRDEFWDTAPAFEGKRETWLALKAAAEAFEAEDFGLAQAILDGAGCTLPNGALVECYDELGTRYSIPVYCISHPLNIVASASGGRDSPAEFSEPIIDTKLCSEEMKLRVRISVSGDDDVRLLVDARDTVASAKRKLSSQERFGGGGGESAPRQRWFFGGKTLEDKSRMGEHNIPSGAVVVCVVNGGGGGAAQVGKTKE